MNVQNSTAMNTVIVKIFHSDLILTNFSSCTATRLKTVKSMKKMKISITFNQKMVVFFFGG